MKRKTVVRILIILLLLIPGLYLLESQLYMLHSKANLGDQQKDTLISIAASALQQADVPVGALLLYNDSILSIGFNTVLRDSNAAGHAEINAINNALRKTGFEAFGKLDRTKLILVSTFEPCLMCRGALIEYNIRRVWFMKGKGLFHWLKNDLKAIRYEWNKKNTGGAELQDSLFMLHPVYRMKNFQ